MSAGQRTDQRLAVTPRLGRHLGGGNRGSSDSSVDSASGGGSTGSSSSSSGSGRRGTATAAAGAAMGCRLTGDALASVCPKLSR